MSLNIRLRLKDGLNRVKIKIENQLTDFKNGIKHLKK